MKRQQPPTPPVKVPAQAGHCWATVHINADPNWPDVANCGLRARPDFLPVTGMPAASPPHSCSRTICHDRG